MDNSNFDAVARAVAAGASRRQVLRLLAIGTVTGWLPGRVGAAPARQDCAAVGLTDCGGVCIDLSVDPFNCGGCGIACESGVCGGGTCTPVEVSLGCVAPLVECAGLCADLSTDPNNCGACGNVCEGGVCEAGGCPQVSLGCVAPLVECAGLCADLSSDPNNCGGCGIVCEGSTCEGGSCLQVDIGCVAPTVDCAGACVDLSVDPNNCGACGNACPGGSTCVGGVCPQASLGCVAPLVECSGLCADLSTDPNNCGACGTVCASGVCTSGVCAESITSPATPAATSTTTPATPAAPTPTSTPPTDGGSTGSNRPRRDRSSRAQGSGSSSTGTASGSAKQARVKKARVKKAAATKGSESVLAWPFDPAAGQWTIVNGYRGEGEHAAPTNSDQNDAVFAFDFGVCRPEDVDVADGTCALSSASASSGAVTDEPGWDTGPTRGSEVLSPVDGTVAWTEEANALCPTVGIAITGHPGYRVALFNVAGRPDVGESVKQGKKIGKVAKEGCAEGDRLHMALYQPQAGAADDPEAGRKGVPFTGAWSIAGCDFPDDTQTANQYRGVLVPCTP